MENQLLDCEDCDTVESLQLQLQYSKQQIVLQNQLSLAKQKYLVFTAEHTHYSVIKIAEIMGLVPIKISGNDDGSMNL